MYRFLFKTRVKLYGNIIRQILNYQTHTLTQQTRTQPETHTQTNILLGESPLKGIPLLRHSRSEMIYHNRKTTKMQSMRGRNDENIADTFF